jgi:hypothetical protein
MDVILSSNCSATFPSKYLHFDKRLIRTSLSTLELSELSFGTASIQHPGTPEYQEDVDRREYLEEWRRSDEGSLELRPSFGQGIRGGVREYGRRCGRRRIWI